MEEKLLTELKLRSRYLENLIREKEKALLDAPEGKLSVRKIGNRTYYCYRTDIHEKTGKYIRRKDESLAADLAQKEYDEKVLFNAKKELKKTNDLIRFYYAGNVEAIYEKIKTAKQHFVKPIRKTDAQYEEEWRNVSYKGNDFAPEAKIYLTDRGENVRSKSELMIANALDHYNIPYRYEYPLKKVKGVPIYPDFTVLNVKKRKTYIWEHFGMMDDSEYANRALDRINRLQMNGYFPGESLIITYETSIHPLIPKIIQIMIEHYFL